MAGYAIFIIRSYNLMLKALLQVVGNLENRVDVSSETLVKEYFEHSRHVLLREVIMKFIEIDQLRSLLITLNLDIVSPFRKSHYKFVQPYFENFAREVLVPILRRY